MEIKHNGSDNGGRIDGGPCGPGATSYGATNYGEWKIQFKPDRINYTEADATLKEGGQVHRYPFFLLSRIGAKLTIINTGIENQVRVSAYQYAKRRGWKITGVIEYDTMNSGVKVSVWVTLTRIA
jgi:hypothetical protein